MPVNLADAAGWDATRRERAARSALWHRDCGRPEVIAGRYSAMGVQAANRFQPLRAYRVFANAPDLVRSPLVNRDAGGRAA